MEKRKILLLFGILVSVFLVSNASALFIGLTDGYIKNVTGGVISGASVTVTVSGCSGGVSNGCSGTDTSDANGYYIVTNLNLPKLGTAVVSATEGSGTGSNSGTADNTQVAHVNVSVCYAPSTPVLTPVSDSHTTTATFSWTSGTDPIGFSTYDEFDLDSSVTTPATSPITRIGLSFATHTWKARTCNAYCCGSWASDTFVIGNSAPSEPTNLNATSDNSTGLTALSWNSGIDSDGDPTHDELEYQNGTVIDILAVSPYDVPTTLLIKWRVRTCDSLGACSAWVTADSVTCSEVTTSATCPACEVCEEETGSKGGSVSGSRFTGKKVELYCNGIPFSNQTLLRIDFGIGDSRKVSLYGVNWSIEDLDYCPWCYNGEKDFDEVGVDCGGASCRPCTEAEIPQGIAWNYLMGISILVLVLVVIYIILKTGLHRKILSGKKY